MWTIRKRKYRKYLNKNDLIDKEIRELADENVLKIKMTGLHSEHNE